MNNKQPILVVDDNPQNLQLLGSLLTQAGYSPAMTQSGIKALEFLQKKTPQLILLDIMMPEMDGFEVCECIKQDPAAKDIPIIFLTAKVDSDSVIKGFDLGGVDYVTKPFNEKELLKRINTHLELKSARDTIAKQNEELRNTNMTKDKFFSIIAHDLRKPFQSLIGLTELMLEELTQTSSDKKYLQYIHDVSQRTFELLQNLLQWSQSQTGKITIQPEKIAVKPMVDSNVALLYASALEKEITINSDIDGVINITVDKNMITTVIRNILSNAIKFTGSQGKIMISASHNDQFVTITIADNGVGIKDKDIAKLFRIDVQHTTLGTQKETGTGLGLLLCKEFVEKNNGHIHVVSEVGKGTQFHIELPL